MNNRGLAKFLYMLLVPCCMTLGFLAASHLSNATARGRPRCRAIPHWSRYITSLTITCVFSLSMGVWAVISVIYRKRSFYLLVINICGIVPLIVANVLGPSVRLTLSPSVCSKTVPICSNETNMFSLVAVRGDRSIRAVCTEFRATIILGYLVIGFYGIICLSLYDLIPPARIRGTMQIVSRFIQSFVKSLRKSHGPFTRDLPFTADEAESNDDIPDLLSILRKNDIASLIAQNLHFVDLLSLGRASKSLRVALFRPRNQQSQREVMRVASCAQGLKRECWTCGTQVCKECTLSTRLQAASATTHLNNCSSYCTKCFYFKVCIQPYSDHKEIMRCSCCPRKSSTGHALAVLEPRDLCRNCAILPQEDALEIRNRRETDGIQVLQSRTLQCSECAKNLSADEQRWWACTLCKQECVWDGHLKVKSKKAV